MTREDNEAEGKTWVYTYDLGGNITSKTTYAYTLDDPDTVLDTAAYSYYTGTWKDLLVGYDGLTINSDTIGNPTEVKQGDTVIRRYTWEHGRQLASLTEDGTTWNYTYNSTGLRTERTNGSKTYTYVYNGSQLTYMTVDGHTLWFSYDAHGPMYVKYDGTTYLYVTNLQGDVIAIVNNSGNAVVEYTYDAWGNILSTSGSLKNTLGAYNPLRYRGYVYDSETGLYYVSSRYYDPEIGRWINADGFVSTGQDITGYNMFAYCGNNPVNRVDPTGQFWKELWDAFTQSIQQASGYFAVAAGITQVDSPAPGPADAVGAAMAIGGLFVCATIAVESIIFAKPTSDIFSNTDEKAQAIAITREPDNPVIFPSNPNDFNPIGLIKVPRAGTKNGAFISWMDPLTNTEVFRWDENPNYPNGPHYHILGTGHYYPGNIVPEPFATIYFPFR